MAAKQMDYRVNVHSRRGEWIATQAFPTADSAVKFAREYVKAGKVPHFERFDREISRWVEDGTLDALLEEKLPSPRVKAVDTAMAQSLTDVAQEARNLASEARKRQLTEEERRVFLYSVATKLREMHYEQGQTFTAFYDEYNGEKTSPPVEPELTPTSEQLPVESPTEEAIQNMSAEILSPKAAFESLIEPVAEEPVKKRRGLQGIFG